MTPRGPDPEWPDDNPIEEFTCPNCNSLLRFRIPAELKCDACRIDILAEWVDAKLLVTNVTKIVEGGLS